MPPVHSASRQDPQWLDLMYNNRARVPDHGRHFERWARESAAFRARQPAGVDLAYGANWAEAH